MAAYFLSKFKTQYDGSPLANQNCSPTTGANGAASVSEGKINKTGGEVRKLVKLNEETNPATPGWSQTDLNLAMQRLGVRFTVRRGTWATILSLVRSGFFISLPGDSDQFPEPTCSSDFKGNHNIGLHPQQDSLGNVLIADPICKAWRWETPTTLKKYAEKFAGGSQITFGLFLDKVPVVQEEMVLEITKRKGQDWVAVKGNGVIRAKPERRSPIVGRVPDGTVVRSISEAQTADLHLWRQIDWPVGSGTPGWILRSAPDLGTGSDWAPANPPVGDPEVDAQLTAYMLRETGGKRRITVQTTVDETTLPAQEIEI